MSIALWVVLFILAAVVISVTAVRLMRKHGWGQKTEAEEKVTWLGLVWNFWYYIPAAVGGLRYIYDAWRKAPPGSPEKLKWGLLLAVIAAVAVRIAISIVDNRINRERIRGVSPEPAPLEIEHIRHG